MTTLECKYCNKKLSTKQSLKIHQQSTKYCLKIQNTTVSDKYSCEFCKKQFTLLHNLNRHQTSCKLSGFHSKILDENELLKKDNEKIVVELSTCRDRNKELMDEMLDLKQEHKREIQILQDKLENVAIQAARRPTQSNTYNRNVNTLIQNMSPLTEDSFKDNSQYLTIEHLKRGVKGYVEYALRYPLKNKVLCVDYSRRKIKYKDGDGKVQTDPEMARLSQKFFESIADKNRVLAAECVDQLSPDMDDCEKMKIMVDMSQLMVEVNQSARGSRTDFTHDFVRGVCGERVC